MTVLTEGRWPGEAIISEGNRLISRDNLTIAPSQTIEASSLLAKKAVTGVVVAQNYSGAGNGVLTLADPAFNSKVKDGTYKVTCVTAAANGGTFRVEDPKGVTIGNAIVGTAFNKEIKFTIADGATDFSVGDTFDINVAADAVDYQYVAYDPAATDGAEIPAAYSIYKAETGVGETVETAGIVRLAELNGNCIAWPPSITQTQRADAVQALADRNIIVRY